MKRIKTFLYLAVATWVFLIVLRILLGEFSLGNLSVEWVTSRLVDPESIVDFLLLTVALLLLSRLRHWPAWSLLLIVLALLGSGIDLPQSLLFYPERQSIVRVVLTLFAIVAFWVLEKLESRYTGADVSGFEPSEDTGENEMVKLNLGADDDKNKN